MNISVVFVDSFRLLSALGAGPKQGGFSPLEIYFKFINDGVKAPTGVEAFDVKTVACYQAATVSFNSESISPDLI